MNEVVEMMRALSRLREHSERGAAAVEFALVIIPLLYIVFGIISYGYMLSFRQALSQGAAEGARAAAVAPSGATSTMLANRARDAVNDSLRNYSISCTAAGKLTHAGGPDGTCAVTGPAECSGSTSSAMCMKVEVKYPYRSNSLIPDVGFGYVLPSSLDYTSEIQVS